MANKYLQTLIARFPEIELSIFRLQRDDPEFRSICEEIEMADAARVRWRDSPDRAEEYQGILDRLEAEFTERVSAASTSDSMKRGAQYFGDEQS